MKLFFEQLAIMVFGAVIITGCSAVSSKDSSPDDYTGYVLGVTTYHDVIKKLGQPDEFYYPDSNCRNFADQCNYFTFVYFDRALNMYLYSFKKDKVLFRVKTHDKCLVREACLLDAERYMGRFVNYHKTMGDYSQDNFAFENYIPDFPDEGESMTVTNRDDSVLYETQGGDDNSSDASEDNIQTTVSETTAGSENNRFNENDSLDDFAD